MFGQSTVCAIVEDGLSNGNVEETRSFQEQPKTKRVSRLIVLVRQVIINKNAKQILLRLPEKRKIIGRWSISIRGMCE